MGLKNNRYKFVKRYYKESWKHELELWKQNLSDNKDIHLAQRNSRIKPSMHQKNIKQINHTVQYTQICQCQCDNRYLRYLTVLARRMDHEITQITSNRKAMCCFRFDIE